MREHLPAGYVFLGGAFLAEHRNEIIAAVKRCEERARGRHPLQRIMSLGDEGDRVLITTTDLHLARRIGEALRRAYRSRLSFRYEADQPLLRVSWTR